MRTRREGGASCNAGPRNRTEAKLLLKELLRKLDDHGEEIIVGDRLRFRDLAKLYEERKLTPPKYQGDVKVSDLRSYQSHQRRLKTLVKHFGKKLIRQITHSDLEQFKLERLALPTKRKEERSHADVNRDLQLLRIVLNFARRQGWLRVTPFERGEALINSAHERSRNRVLSRDEETRLLRFADWPTGRRCVSSRPRSGTSKPDWI